jgi:hypothetical protein
VELCDDLVCESAEVDVEKAVVGARLGHTVPYNSAGIFSMMETSYAMAGDAVFSR